MTKHLLILITTMGFAACASAPSDCSRARLGRFRDTGQWAKDYYITRTEHELTEEIPGEGKVTKSKLVWVDSCTYMAFGRRVVQGTPDMVQPTDTMIVHITSIDDAGFSYSATVHSSNPDLDGVTVPGRQLFEP